LWGFSAAHPPGPVQSTITVAEQPTTTVIDAPSPLALAIAHARSHSWMVE
jgi:hypothetical protein